MALITIVFSLGNIPFINIFSSASCMIIKFSTFIHDFYSYVYFMSENDFIFLISYIKYEKLLFFILIFFENIKICQIPNTI